MWSNIMDSRDIPSSSAATNYVELNFFYKHIINPEESKQITEEEQLSSAKWQYWRWVMVKHISRLLMAGDAVGAFFLSKHMYDNIETISNAELCPEATAIGFGAPLIGYGLYNLSVFAKNKHQIAEKEIAKLESRTNNNFNL
jgi:hypothetical protein